MAATTPTSSPMLQNTAIAFTSVCASYILFESRIQEKEFEERNPGCVPRSEQNLFE